MQALLLQELISTRSEPQGGAMKRLRTVVVCSSFLNCYYFP
jgi:hypothetical protein